MLNLRGCEKIGRGMSTVTCSLAMSLPAAGGVPTFSAFQLQCRSNLSANPSGSFNIPVDTFFANGTPALNDSGRVAIKLDVMGGSGSQGVWSGINGAGGIVYTSPVDASLSDCSINGAGLVVFPQTLSSQNGLRYYDSSAMTGGLITTEPSNATSWGNPIVNDAGQIGFRATLVNGQAFMSYQSGMMLTHAADASAQSGSPYSFLFSAAFNDQRQFAAHVRLGAAGQTGNSQPDEVRVFNSDGSSALIARDRDADAGSPYSAFDSSRPAINASGRVAFIANLVAGGRGVFLSDGATTTTLATTTSPGVTAIDFFPPAINAAGWVAFRGRDGNGLSAIFVADGTALRRVIGEHDLLPSDQGMARIDQHDNSPVFGGSISINANGDVAFQCSLTPPANNQVEWGSGLYIAQADPVQVPGDVTGDGLVDIDDLLAVINQWGNAGGPADVTLDGVVDIDDLLFVITHWS